MLFGCYVLSPIVWYDMPYTATTHPSGSDRKEAGRNQNNWKTELIPGVIVESVWVRVECDNAAIYFVLSRL